MTRLEEPYTVAVKWPGEPAVVEISGDGDDGVGASFVTLFVDPEDVDDLIADLIVMKKMAEEMNENDE